MTNVVEVEALEGICADFGEAWGTDLVTNQVAEALVRRIEKAIIQTMHFEHQCHHDDTLDDGTFRVIILIPNFPEGAVTDISVQASVGPALQT